MNPQKSFSIKQERVLSKSKIVGVFDYDALIYSAGFAGEKRTIEAKHLETGEVFVFANRTEMWGRGKKLGGWMLEANKTRVEAGLVGYTKEDFEIVDVQTAEPIAQVLHTVKQQVTNALESIGAKEYLGYIGGKEVPLWRLERSTLLEYKGNRADALSPIYKQAIIDYLVDKHGATVVNDGKEADDHVIIDAMSDPDNRVICGVDKDVDGNPVRNFNLNNPEWGIRDGRKFGEIDWDEKKKKVVGLGRKFFYYQVLFGDPVDNYSAHCFSEQAWGAKTAYEWLRDAKTDEEALLVLKRAYRYLYPEKKTIVGWRGDEIEIDWLYVLNEVWDMARMWRKVDDYVTAEQVLGKFNLL